MALVDTLKKINNASTAAGAPMAIMFGVVTSASPLAVMVENRFTVSGSMLVVPKEFKAGFYDTHKHRLTPDEPETGEIATKSGEVDEHTHKLKDEYWTNSEDNSLKEREYYYGLKAGEKVILLRDAGGQRFLIVGRL